MSAETTHKLLCCFVFYGPQCHQHWMCTGCAERSSDSKDSLGFNVSTPTVTTAVYYQFSSSLDRNTQNNLTQKILWLQVSLFCMKKKSSEMTFNEGRKISLSAGSVFSHVDSPKKRAGRRAVQKYFALTWQTIKFSNTFRYFVWIGQKLRNCLSLYGRDLFQRCFTLWEATLMSGCYKKIAHCIFCFIL